MSLLKRICIALLIGSILSYCSNWVFTLILARNNLPPFYKGISPNYFEVIIFALIPILVYSGLYSKKKKNLPIEVMSYFLIISLGILGWTIGIYEQTIYKLSEDPQNAFFLGYLGKFEWHLRQKIFLMGIFIGLILVFISNKVAI